MTPKPSTKERIENIINPLGSEWVHHTKSAVDELADALIQAGLVFKDEVDNKDDRRIKSIGLGVLQMFEDLKNRKEFEKAIATHTKDLLTFERTK